MNIDVAEPEARQAAPPRGAFARRLEIMRQGIDFAHHRCVEIGPLADPIIAKSEGNILYVDRTTTEALRAEFRAESNQDASRVVDVDAIWGEQSLSACLGGATFDFVLASHVAEHVPDLITWLREVAAVLKPAGQLRLVLPDPRFSFDVLRDETTLLDVLTNYVLRARRPQVRNVLDFRLHYAPAMDGRQRYIGRLNPADLKPGHTFEEAMQSAGWLGDMPRLYLDVHCWVFRPATFARLMADLAERALVPFACAGIFDTAPPLFEYCVFLTPCDDPAQAAESWRAVVPDLHDPLPGSAEAQARHESAEAELARMRNSLSWRLTAPLRSINAKTKEQKFFASFFQKRRIFFF